MKKDTWKVYKNSGANFHNYVIEADYVLYENGAVLFYSDSKVKAVVTGDYMVIKQIPQE